MSAYLRAANLPVKIKGLGRWFDRDIGVIPPSYWMNLITTSGAGISVPFAGVDSSINTYMAVNSLTSERGIHFFKVNKNGILQWSNRLFTATSFSLLGFASDVNGNGFCLCVDPSTTQAFIFKFDSTGAVVWQKFIYTPVASIANGQLCLDSAGNVLVFFDDNNLGIVGKFNGSNGAFIWGRLLTAATTINALSIVCDSLNNVFVGGGADNGGGLVDCLLAKYNSSGVLQWQKTDLTPGNQSIISQLGITSANNLITAGQVNLAGNGVSLVNTSGIWQNGNIFTASLLDGISVFSGLYVDGSNNVYVTGYGAPSATNRGLVVKLNSSLAIDWQRKITSGTNTRGGSVVIDSSGGVVFTDIGNWAGPNQSGLLWRTPVDGSKTGTYNGYTYAASALTMFAGSDFLGAGALTDASQTLTSTNCGFTSGTSTFNFALTNIT